ncbi:MAG TPA: glycosyltransferase family 4 protein [Vicinamibacterales bacterium]|nr:glycosyltransferase family 4 protein [Vicinamibacterales bacterium]
MSIFTDPIISGGSNGRAAAPNVRWVNINGRLRGARHPAEWRQHLALSGALRRASTPDTVVHCGRPLPEGLPGLVGSLRLIGRRLPYVCWSHGEELTVALTSKEHRALATVVCRRAALMLTSSRFASSVVASVGVPSDRIRVIHPGVDTSRFNTALEGSAIRARYAPGADCVLLTVGRLQRRKGHDTTIAALGMLRKELPGLRYLIAGDGTERPRLEALAAERGVADLVTFLGPVSDQDLPAMYAACDVFVMASRQEGADVEGFGIVFLEAAAAGRPTIAGKTGGMGEAVADGRTGILVKGDEVPELAKAIRQLASSRDLRIRMGEEGRRRVLADFEWSRAARQVDEAQAEILAGR